MDSRFRGNDTAKKQSPRIDGHAAKEGCHPRASGDPGC